MSKFRKAQRKKAKLRLEITGPSGSGKTYSALLIAKGLGGRIAVVDTEHGSASLYAHLVDFDVLELSPPYTPEAYQEAIREAERAGYDTLIIDSITHEWSGKGGCLEIVDDLARAKYKGNSWSAWNDVTPRHRDFVDAILQSRMHVIATARSKTETAQTDDAGRKKVVKLGMKQEQRDGTEYEFTVVFDLVHDGHFAIATKDRTGLFSSGNPSPIDTATGENLREWLEYGDEVKKPEKISEAQVRELRALIKKHGGGESAWLAYWQVSGVSEIGTGRFDGLREELNAAIGEAYAKDFASSARTEQLEDHPDAKDSMK